MALSRAVRFCPTWVPAAISLPCRCRPMPCVAPGICVFTPIPRANRWPTSPIWSRISSPNVWPSKYLAPEGAIAPDGVLPVSVEARYLYGATAPGLDIEADAILRPRTTLADYPGYTFGREDDTVRTDQIPLGIVGKTDEAGLALAEVRPARILDNDASARRRSHPPADRFQRPSCRALADPSGHGRQEPHRYPAGLQRHRTRGRQARRRSTSSRSRPKVGWRSIRASAGPLSRIQTTYQWYRDGGTCEVGGGSPRLPRSPMVRSTPARDGPG